jgi:hypothetical protein
LLSNSRFPETFATPASAIMGLADRDAALFACVIHKFGASYSGGKAQEGSGRISEDLLQLESLLLVIEL